VGTVVPIQTAEVGVVTPEQGTDRCRPRITPLGDGSECTLPHRWMVDTAAPTDDEVVIVRHPVDLALWVDTDPSAPPPRIASPVNPVDVGIDPLTFLDTAA
jgi:hypothetical protein